jgi:predicted Rossmann fold nucleotide-binding protein DprA/Smf involved in DNA uptake
LILEIKRISKGGHGYPEILAERLGDTAPEAIYSLGDLSILQNRMVGLICSVQCPGSIVLKTFDLIRKLRDAGVVLIGGFHCPMEKDCLDLLLRGPQTVVICMPKRLQNIHFGSARQAFSEGRLLVISRFGDEVRQASAKQAMERNDLVAALSQVVLVPHASPNGKTWEVVKRAIDRGQKIASFDDPANAHLMALGAADCSNADAVLEELGG